MPKTGKLFLIPTYLSPDNTPDILAPTVQNLIQNIQYYLVENTRTSRRFISSLKLGIKIEALQFQHLDKNTDPSQIDQLLQPMIDGIDMGLMSEAGLPAIADPGQIAVSRAHQLGINVVPLPGPSSIIQALIASGFSGQQFTFHGYLPIDKQKRKSVILQLEREVEKTGYTQLFMETPYRNKSLLDTLTSVLRPGTYLSIATGITSKQERIHTATVDQWRKTNSPLEKIPAIFSLGILG